MKSLGYKNVFPLAGFMQPIKSTLTYMPVLTEGQKLIAACGSTCQFLWLCEKDSDIADLNWIWGKTKISWYIMPSLDFVPIGVVITETEVIEIAQIVTLSSRNSLFSKTK